MQNLLFRKIMLRIYIMQHISCISHHNMFLCKEEVEPIQIPKPTGKIMQILLNEWNHHISYIFHYTQYTLYTGCVIIIIMRWYDRPDRHQFIFVFSIYLLLRQKDNNRLAACFYFLPHSDYIILTLLIFFTYLYIINEKIKNF